MLINWLCSSLMILPCSFARSSATFASSPGLSGRRTDTVKILSLWIRPCWTIEDIVITSIFPPLSIETIFFFSTFKCFKAATVRSPEFSTIILWFSTISRKATINSLSSMVMMSSTFCWMYGNSFSPGRFTAVPSAMVFTWGSVNTFPSFKDSCIQLAPAGSTPMTLIFGFNSFARVETPVQRPPPPIGTKI